MSRINCLCVSLSVCVCMFRAYMLVSLRFVYMNGGINRGYLQHICWICFHLSGSSHLDLLYLCCSWLAADSIPKSSSRCSLGSQFVPNNNNKNSNSQMKDRGTISDHQAFFFVFRWHTNIERVSEFTQYRLLYYTYKNNIIIATVTKPNETENKIWMITSERASMRIYFKFNFDVLAMNKMKK